jgi:hypothetical protein
VADVGLQGARLVELHATALDLRDAMNAAFAQPSRVHGDAETRARAAMARLTAATQMMEIMSWLLVRHAGSDLQMRWHTQLQAPRGLSGQRATVAAAIDRLYAELVAINAGPDS